jgi:NAD+ kinase
VELKRTLTLLLRLNLLTMSPEGDHIKVTASRYPFPTVCADRQSTDWFQSISRTLKWNERERQKSFVVVEENPNPKPQKKKQPVGEAIPEEGLKQGEEEVDSEGEEVEDTFDIDFLSPNPATETKLSMNSTTSAEEIRARNKTDELLESKEVNSKINLTKSLRSAGLPSKISIDHGSPGRFGQPIPHPPNVSPRHIGLGMHMTKIDVPKLELGQPTLPPPAYDAGDHVISPSFAKLVKEKDRDEEMESPNLQTPRARNAQPNFHAAKPHPPSDRPSRKRAWTVNGRNWRSRSQDTGRSEASQHRAFAAWGYDESDASDNENF